MKRINKKLAALFLVLVVAVGTTACGSTIGDMDIAQGESAVYIQEDGKVSYGVAEKFDKDYYDESKLEDTINKEVADYNDGKKASVKNAITVDTFKVKSDVATLVLEFATAYDFSTYIKEYNKVESSEFFIGKIADNSYCKIKGDFTSPDKKKDATAKEIKAMEDANILIIKGKYKVQLDEDVKYISSNCSVDDDGIVTTDDSDENLSYIVY